MTGRCSRCASRPPGSIAPAPDGVEHQRDRLAFEGRPQAGPRESFRARRAARRACAATAPPRPRLAVYGWSRRAVAANAILVAPVPGTSTAYGSTHLASRASDRDEGRRRRNPSRSTSVPTTLTRAAIASPAGSGAARSRGRHARGRGAERRGGGNAEQRRSRPAVLVRSSSRAGVRRCVTPAST